MGARLDGVASESIRVMHDRRIPRSKAYIDHIVVSPGGLSVMDTKQYKMVGRLPSAGEVLWPKKLTKLLCEPQETVRDVAAMAEMLAVRSRAP